VNTTRITIPRGKNPHTHLREEPDVMRDLIRASLEGGIDTLGPMPNTKAGLMTAKQVTDYITLARSLVPSDEIMNFIPIGMVNEQTTKLDIEGFLDAGIRNVKVYPLGRTTNSHYGVRDYSKLLPIVKYGGDKGMVFHFHPEHPWMSIENRDAEYLFLSILDMYMRETNAIIVSEHGTDTRCIPMWKEWGKTGRFYLTLTAHHPATNESKSFGVVQSVCKPPIKTELDRLNLLTLIKENHTWVMLGADNAFHPKEAKHRHDGEPCACGADTTHFILQLCAHVLDDLLQTPEGIKTFVNFTSGNAQRFHDLPDSSGTVTLVREPFQIPLEYPIGSYIAEPFWLGKTLNWRIEG
jgi:dihydroorotase